MAIDYYRVLELPQGASLSDIKKAYRKMAKLYHPDRNTNPRAEEAFVLVNEAYVYLSDPVRRAAASKQGKPRYSQERRQQHQARWQEQESQVRQKAHGHAHASFEEFAKTPIYKAAMVLDEIYNYVFIGMGVVMMTGPVIGALNMDDADKQDFNYYGLLIPIIIGAGFIYIIWKFAIKGEWDQ